MIRVKRVYEPPGPDDGTRILVDRLWPRGIAKAAANWDHWMKDLAPSDSLRRWFGHDPRKWRAFLARYHEELVHSADAVALLVREVESGAVTLLYSARDERHNNAVALKAYLEVRSATERPLEELGEVIRDAVLKAALDAYDDAGVRGLCAEGRWEIAMDAVRHFDLSHILERKRS
jgi:uncharacterized protein YeaO (DUF488 family)